MSGPSETAGVDSMNDEELAPHVEELKKVLQEKVDETTLYSELHRYLDDYHVDIVAAKRGIARKFGATDTPIATAANASKKIADLNGSEQSVDILAKVVYVERKNIQVKGLEKTIISGIIGDDSGTASFTIWEAGSVDLQKGSTNWFRNCYCKRWNDRVQINIGNRGRVEPSNEELNVPERDVTLVSKDVKIGDIRENMGNVNVVGKILSIESRKVNSRGEEKVVYSGIIADDTGKIQYSAWHNFHLKEGVTISAKNCYIRAWRGIPQLNIGDRAVIEVSHEDVQIAEDQIRTIDEINRIGGGLDITLEGVVVDMKAGSGLIKRCPQCNRALNDGMCNAHGTVEGVPDMRMKLVIDDGTGAIGAVVNRQDTEKLTGVTMSMATGLAAARGEGIIAREIMGRILLRKVRLSGNVMKDDYGSSMIVHSAENINTDIKAEAEKLLEEVEAEI